MDAYQRNTNKVHPLAGGIKQLGKRDTGSEPLTDDNALLWYGSISIGTQADSLTGIIFLICSPIFSSDHTLYAVDFDTGSSDLFVPSVNCASSCSGHETYDPSASANSQDLGVPFDISFGDGSVVSGEQYSDVVSIAGLTVSPTSPLCHTTSSLIRHTIG